MRPEVSVNRGLAASLPLTLLLGRKDLGLGAHPACREERSGRLVYLGIERAFDPLRSDPRFQDLVRRLRLPA
jgi:hypothetical protein